MLGAPALVLPELTKPFTLFFIDTFSGWVEVYPTKKETSTVAKKILEENFPRFGIPKVLGSDNGPAFVAQSPLGHDGHP
ncbi:Gm29423 [Phodopus roborovskii]|uniref:Gm29423 protein n=1 Tax=Phodopus roborovskii TaxID=109678 RepID=A0AAU9YUE9_PHORO|nr:Gm29423 [Phodopus roborovskii]